MLTTITFGMRLLVNLKNSIKFPLSQEDVNVLGNKLSNELSPENLHCDGEISRNQAQRNTTN